MPITIGKKTISNESPCYLIAEIGVNHGGDMQLARKMIEAAKAAGADAVKFQTFTAEGLVTRGTPKVRYQESTTSASESHYDMIKKLELRREDHAPLMRHCEQCEIEFLSTPYDLESAMFLQELGVKAFKTASADIVDLPLHEFLARTGKPVIAAVGMATLGEIEEAVSVYRPSAVDNLVLLHCVSNYPCSDSSLNLKVMNTIRNAFGTLVGFSDHSIGEQAACLSIALGACVIEKHFTLDKNMPGPDHKASSTPDELAALVRAVRRAEVSLGTPWKACQPEEAQMSQVSRKSIVLRRAVKANAVITSDDIVMKRPGTGLPARAIKSVLGKKAATDLEKDAILTWGDLS